MMNQNENVDSVQMRELLTKQPILLFDGECGFCNKTIQFFLSHENSKKKVHFCALESENGMALKRYFEIDPSVDSIILIRDHSAFIKSCAALRLTRYMSGLWPLFLIFIIVPPFLRNMVYDFIAKRRQKIAGRIHTCVLLKDEDQSRFL